MDAVWSWGIAGLILLAAELATGTLYILWFGIAGLVVSLLLWINPTLAVAWQLFWFAVLSLVSLLAWKKFEKKQPAASRLGQSQGEEIGRIGIISMPVSADLNGRIRFAQGVMGSREWTAISQETLLEGEEAVIAGIEGNALRVTKKPTA